MKHPVAHAGHYNCDAEIRTCPHNIYHIDHYGNPRHDEWHRCDDRWTKRES